MPAPKAKCPGCGKPFPGHGYGEDGRTCKTCFDKQGWPELPPSASQVKENIRPGFGALPPVRSPVIVPQASPPPAASYSPGSMAPRIRRSVQESRQEGREGKVSPSRDKPPATPHSRRRPGHLETRTVHRRGARAPFQQKFFVTEKDPKRKKRPRPEVNTAKLHSLFRRLGKLLRERDLSPKVAARAHKLRERLQRLMSDSHKTAVDGVASAVREVTSSAKKKSEVFLVVLDT